MHGENNKVDKFKFLIMKNGTGDTTPVPVCMLRSPAQINDEETKTAKPLEAPEF